MSPKAEAFIKANAESPVVAGYAREKNPHKPARGGVYTLDDGRKFTLGVADCIAVGMPRWKL